VKHGHIGADFRENGKCRKLADTRNRLDNLYCAGVRGSKVHGSCFYLSDITFNNIQMAQTQGDFTSLNFTNGAVNG
jgi:hypothetical protein